MGKQSGWTRGNTNSIVLIGGGGYAEITDDIHDYYLPKGVRSKLEEIEQLKSFNELKAYFEKQGIELTSDLDLLHGRADDEIPIVRDTGQRFAVAIETYKEVYGADALKKLKRINLYAKWEDAKAAYYYNRRGENDPLAGTIQTRDFLIDGRQIYHELAHAFQDSKAKRNEDAVSFSARILKEVKAKNVHAYFGARSSDLAAEQMADAMSYGFHQGKKDSVRMIMKIRKAIKR